MIAPEEIDLGVTGLMLLDNCVQCMAARKASRVLGSI